MKDESLKFITDPSIAQESKLLFGFKSLKRIPKNGLIELALPHFRTVENVSGACLNLTAKSEQECNITGKKRGLIIANVRILRLLPSMNA